MTSFNIFKSFQGAVAKAIEDLASAGALPGGLDLTRVAVEPPRDPAHGDLASNVGMVLAKPAGQKPRDIAQKVGERLAAEPGLDVIGFTVDGPGFLNLRVADAVWQGVLRGVLQAGNAYGDSDIGRGVKVNVEYVSANPTGPMHVGHGRGAVVGDVLATLLAKAGFAVTREYYINDAGAQVDMLARSAHLRYREALGESIGAVPEGFYPGDYLVEVGRALAARDGTKWRDVPEAAWLVPVRDFAIDAMMALIRADLAALGVRHDVFSSERALVAAGAVDQALADLQAKDLVYVGTLEPPKGKVLEDWEPRPQTLFRSSQFGDDVDRPLKKSDGSWTYFAADMAYHRDKVRRGFPLLIDVWGADHGGYVKRMQAAVKALTDGAGVLDVRLCQLVNLLDAGQPVRMSKRAGTFVTLREVVDEVGKDVVRFIMLTRKNDAALDFDLKQVVEQTKDNPVFYVQYAHARAASVMRHAAAELNKQELNVVGLLEADLKYLTDPAELGLIRQLANWPRIVEAAAEAHEPHRVAFYLNDLAAGFHALWNKGKDDATLRFVVPGDPDQTLARLALVQGVKNVLAVGLAVLGVVPAEEMR
ncbi:MAG TPA: arginine--tRNA ligase [Candidatus Sulfotelmatobacter sp.]|nr:arginine--tRNA ligase [Candidatus Sulfotelmatobacter sp.]